MRGLHAMGVYAFPGVAEEKSFLWVEGAENRGEV